MSAAVLSDMYLYPVKSFAGIRVESAVLDRFGLVGDRRWMLVDQNNNALTQRECSAMALVQTQLAEFGLRISVGGESMNVTQPLSAMAQPVEVVVWEDRVQALDAGDDIGHWLSERLALACRLVFMPDHSERPVNKKFAKAGETVSFADGFPLLLISQASLDDLNSRMEQSVPMNRFRPNLVVSGCAAFEEDRWRRIRIGDVEFELPKPCARCVMPSIDQATGMRDKAINRVLAGFRRRNGAIFFGQNLLYKEMGILNISAPLKVIE